MDASSELYVVYNVYIRRKVVMTEMLNEGDIELIHEWRDEMLSHRQRPVTVIYLENQSDPLTGAAIGEQEESREVIAVVTDLSIKKVNGSRSLDASVLDEEGDIRVDISIEL